MGRNLLEALNVRVEGTGQKYLVLAHGFGTDQSAWQRILPYFTPYYKVILYDLACAGSVNPDFFDFRRYTTLDAYVDDLLDILDALGVTRCAYVGHSVSAMIGILASIRRRDLLSKLILIGASPRSFPISSFFFFLKKQKPFSLLVFPDWRVSEIFHGINKEVKEGGWQLANNEWIRLFVVYMDRWD